MSWSTRDQKFNESYSVSGDVKFSSEFNVRENFLPLSETVSQSRSWFESLTTNGIA
jgi:hypothetical protein